MSSSSILMLAVAKADVKTTKLLLSKGADLFFKSEFEDWNVFDEAQRVNNPEINKLLERTCEKSISNRIMCRSKQANFFFYKWFNSNKQ